MFLLPENAFGVSNGRAAAATVPAMSNPAKCIEYFWRVTQYFIQQIENTEVDR